jgi:hypothetical protein
MVRYDVVGFCRNKTNKQLVVDMFEMESGCFPPISSSLWVPSPLPKGKKQK